MAVCLLLSVHRAVIFAIAQLFCLQAGCPSCRPTNSVEALKAFIVSQITDKSKATKNTDWL